MKTWIFLKKEFLDFFRSGKALTLTAVFVLFALLNPLITQLTPWLMETLKDELGGAGLVVGDMKVDASMSWMQFFKNASMSVIVFVFVLGGIFTNEYQSGTLVLVTTKGVKRSSVLLAKTILLLVVWTVEHWLGFWITYGYNALYWDNGVVENLLLKSFSWWLFGCWVVSLLLLCSVVFRNMSFVLLGVGGGVFISYMIGIVPVLTKFTPTYLMTGSVEKIVYSVVITTVLSVAAIVASIPIFNKKQL